MFNLDKIIKEEKRQKVFYSLPIEEQKKEIKEEKERLVKDINYLVDMAEEIKTCYDPLIKIFKNLNKQIDKVLKKYN